MPPFEYSFIFTIACLRKAFRREFEVRAAEVEITAAQFQVLRRLWMGDGIPTSALAQDAGSDGGTMTGLLDRLEARGLIRRERSTQDRRAVLIWLTPDGRALEPILMNIITEINRQALDGLTDKEKQFLLDILNRVGNNLNA